MKERTEQRIKYIFAGDSLYGITPSFFVYKQAFVATAASHTAEVSGLKQSLERAEEELGQVKKQLEDNQGMQKTLFALA